jgi:hypothetical protein
VIASESRGAMGASATSTARRSASATRPDAPW